MILHNNKRRKRFFPAASGICPVFEKDDIALVITTLLHPATGKNRSPLNRLKKWFTQAFDSEDVYLLNSGRSSLFFLLTSAGIGKGDDVAIQAYTALGAVNPVLWVGAKPIYIDITEDTFSMNPADLEKKITPHTKAIIVQHSFGIVADMMHIKDIAQKNGCLVIEDISLALGAQVQNRKAGSWGDATFCSLGKSKPVSCISGGVALINSPRKFRHAHDIYKTIPPANLFPTLTLMVKTLIEYLAFHCFTRNWNKCASLLIQIFSVMNLPYEEVEFEGHMPPSYVTTLSPLLAPLGLHQLSKLERYNTKRRALAKRFGPIQEGGIYAAYPLLTAQSEQIRARCTQNGIVLSNWYTSVIGDKRTNLQQFGYIPHSCPVAEKATQQVILLPTYPKMTEQEVTILTDALKHR